MCGLIQLPLKHSFRAGFPAAALGHCQVVCCSVEVTTNSDYSREQFEVLHEAQAGLELYDLGWSQTLVFGFPCPIECIMQAPPIQAETPIHPALPSPLPASGS